MTVSKAGLTVTSLAFALLFGGGVYLYMNMNSYAKQFAEKAARDALGVNVSIGAVNVSIKDKRVVVKNITVDNPAGYDSAYAAKIETIAMQADSFSQTLLNFQNVRVSGTDVNLEVKSQGSNLNDLKNTVNANAAQGDAAAEQIQVIIQNLNIVTMRVQPTGLLAELGLEPISVPPISLNNIGSGQNGTSAKQAIAQIWVPVAEQINKQAMDAGFYKGLPMGITKNLGVGQVNQIKEKIKRDIDKAKEELKDIFGN